VFPQILTRCRTPGGSCFFAATALACLLTSLPVPAQPPLPAVALHVGNQTVQAEYANTPDTLREGLMARTSMPENHGMLFELGDPDIQCFWMKDTLIPLSIAFIDHEGTIVDIQDMAPQNLAPHCPPVAITQALEMNLGWFERTGVKIGDRVHR